MLAHLTLRLMLAHLTLRLLLAHLTLRLLLVHLTLMGLAQASGLSHTQATDLSQAAGPFHTQATKLWGASVIERYRARHQTATVRISNPVSGGQCNLIHLTILKSLSWHSLASMCTKVA